MYCKAKEKNIEGAKTLAHATFTMLKSAW